MGEDDVKYRIDLDGGDKFIKNLEGAKMHTDALEHSMHHLREILMEVVSAYAGFEVLKESLTEWKDHQAAVAQLTTMYENNKNSVNENLDQLKELAEQQEKLTGIHSESTMAAEANLMKYKDLKLTQEELIPVAADLAAALHTDIADAANTLGRSLENPARAMRLLMQTGASPAQVKMFENLEKTGHAAKAQAYIIDVLKDKYHGLAESIFQSDPLNRLDIEFKQVKESIGEFLTEGLQKIMPYIQQFAEGVKDSIHWLKEHSGVVKAVVEVIGTVVAAYVIYTGTLKVVAMWEGITSTAMALTNGIMVAAEAFTLALAEGMGVLEAAQWALNIAMDANPIGVIILGVAALIAIIYECYEHFEGFRRVVGIAWAGLKDYGMAVWDWAIAPLKTLIHVAMAAWDALRGDFSGAKENIRSIADDWMAAFKDIKNGITDVHAAYNADYSRKDSGKETDPTKKLSEVKKGASSGMGIGPSQSDKVTGTKQVNINIVIQKMTGIETVMVQKLKDIGNTAGESILKSLTGAVNQTAASQDI